MQTKAKGQFIQTKDLYYGAYLLVNGNSLEDAITQKNGPKKEVVFSFAGESIMNCANEYISAKAFANVNQLRAAIDHLKRIAYQRLNVY